MTARGHRQSPSIAVPASRRARRDHRRRTGPLLTVCSAILIAAPAGARGAQFGAPGLPDPQQAVRAGLPLLPDAVRRESLPAPGGMFPFAPLDRDSTEGLRHGWVQTSSGRFGFQTTDLALPGRTPLTVGRAYDLGIAEYAPSNPGGESCLTSRNV